jgi:N-acetylglucosamine-6-sulfatase
MKWIGATRNRATGGWSVWRMGGWMLVPLLALSLFAFHGAAYGVATPPTIVVIMTDDQPALDGRLMQFMPNAKSLFVDGGVSFADFHSESPLCCPSRVGFLTGQHTHNHHVFQNRAALFNPSMSLPTQLHALGYDTFLVGKYMNGYDAPSCKPDNPNCAPNIPPGWDRWAALDEPAFYNYTLWQGAAPGLASPVAHGSAPADYSTDVIRELAIQDLRAAPSNQPVFAWIAVIAPHDPTIAAPRNVDAPCPVAKWKPPNWNEADVSDKPLYVQQRPLLKGDGTSLIRECRTLLAVDDLVGAVRDELSAEGRLSNSVLVYAGDNGMEEGEHRLKNKQTPYVTQIPFYLRWPAVQHPRTIAERLQNIDFAPTMCEIAGCTLGPFPNGQQHPDGRSFKCLLVQTCQTLGRDAVIDEMPHATGKNRPDWWAVTTTPASPLGLWHYIEYSTGERELYPLTTDPWELENQAGNPQYADVQSALATRVAELKTER